MAPKPLSNNLRFPGVGVPDGMPYEPVGIYYD